MKRHHLIKSAVSAAMVWAMAMLPIAAMAQTRLSMPNNRYSVQDDVKLGREAAVEVEKQFPILNDYQATEYVSRIGENLVAAIPPQFRQPAFDYSFKIVNASDINAFALPGGPMYVNRGMIQAANNEGEMAGVMAHEIAHIAMRHATAQATKQGSWKSQLGTIGAILGGAILGGQTGAQLGALGVQMWQTRYSREYETHADILGSQIMARAGYDPRDLANMFQTIAREGGGRVPEFLSSHPDPGNRFQTINREAQLLEVSSNPIKITR
ncbi:MAG TPA: M48 family metallopeptidase, partial [Pyrinomonadaceae bacterium]|nr:M48 family metallopeptidase [Pyrinomonadaceae bacterium]